VPIHARVLAFVLAAGLAGVGAPAAAFDSVPALLAEAECASPPAADAERYAARDLGAQECPGLAPFRVFFIASDTSSWLDVAYPGGLWSAEQAVVYEHPVGLFPNVGSGGSEWRLDDAGRPVALIVRIEAQDPEQPDQPERIRSELLVVRLQPDGACLIGRDADLAAARAIADGPERCPPPAPPG